MIDLLRQQAEARPQHPAVVEDGGVLSYSDLVDRADRVAARLIELGARRDHPVALYLPRGTDLVVAACAVLMSGAAYLALDTDHPATRARRLLAASGARIILTSGEPAQRMVGTDATVVDPCAELLGEVGGLPDVDPEAGAYLAYTSGSTGEPRGVLVSHQGLTNLIRWYGEQYTVTPADLMTQLARPSFDAFALEVWPCLAHGATLRVVPRRLLAAPAELVSWLCAERITVGFVPTPLAAELFTAPWPAEAAMRTMLIGGDRLAHRPPTGLPFRVFNNYGPTEATVVATCGEVPPDDPAGDPPPIGLPVPGVTARVVADDGVDADVGELVLGGAGIARGYIGETHSDGALTIDEPFVDASGTPTYRTGDRVRRAADGRLLYLGRDDDQLKINGIRIEPAEVEAALERQPAIRSAAVVPHSPETGGEAVLVAYVVFSDGDKADVTALRDQLADELPAAMVPAAVVPLAALPLTTHGKVNRRELADRSLTQLPGDGVFATAMELLLADLWKEALGVGDFDAHSHFFEVGGDSLRVLRLVRKAGMKGLRLLPDDVYEYPVLRDLAVAITADNDHRSVAGSWGGQ